MPKNTNQMKPIISVFSLIDSSSLLSLALVASIVVNILLLLGKVCASQPQATKKKKRVDRSKTYPKQFPIGWYRICNSDELKIGDTKHVCYLDQEMVVFRGENGSIGVLDAFCPHLGANLAVDGTVVGNNIRCPFHLWEFSADGKCDKIPYCDKIPSNAKTYSWPCEEKYGMVMVWFHPERIEPLYPCISIPELDEGKKFTQRGSYLYEDVKMHLQEFAENSADMQHFSPLHGTLCIPWTGPRSRVRAINVPFVKIIHEAGFALAEEPYIANFFNTAYLSVFGKKLSSAVKAHITFYGPGGITLFRFDGDFGRIYLFHTHTPDSFTNLDVQFMVYAESRIPRLLVWYIVGNWIAQWQNDIAVWENKVHRKDPLLVKNDGPIMKMRRWYKQFYGSSLEW